jgi:hypothetical protein
MSQQTYLAWYACREDIDPLHVLKHMPALVGLKEGRTDRVLRTTRTILSLEDEEDEDYLYLGREILGTELFRLYLPETALLVAAAFAALGDRVEKIVRDEIPVAVRGDFIPNIPSFTVGHHYLYDNVREQVIANPIVAIECWGYSTPRNGPEMVRLLSESKALHAEKSKCEHLLGDLTQVLYYSV